MMKGTELSPNIKYLSESLFFFLIYKTLRWIIKSRKLADFINEMFSSNEIYDVYLFNILLDFREIHLWFGHKYKDYVAHSELFLLVMRIFQYTLTR